MEPDFIIPANMIELLLLYRLHQRQGARFASASMGKGPDDSDPGLAPIRRLKESNDRVLGGILLKIRVRAEELLDATLDEHHGEDPTLAQETRAYLLWAELRR